MSRGHGQATILYLQVCHGARTYYQDIIKIYLELAEWLGVACIMPKMPAVDWSLAHLGLSAGYEGLQPAEKRPTFQLSASDLG